MKARRKISVKYLRGYVSGHDHFMVIFKDLDAKRIYVNKRQLVRASTLNNKIKIEKNAEKLHRMNLTLKLSRGEKAMLCVPKESIKL